MQLGPIQSKMLNAKWLWQFSITAANAASSKKAHLCSLKWQKCQVKTANEGSFMMHFMSVRVSPFAALTVVVSEHIQWPYVRPVYAMFDCFRAKILFSIFVFSDTPEKLRAPHQSQLQLTCLLWLDSYERVFNFNLARLDIVFRIS